MDFSEKVIIFLDFSIILDFLFDKDISFVLFLHC